MNPQPFKDLKKQLDQHVITKEEFSRKWDLEKARQREQDAYKYKGEC